MSEWCTNCGKSYQWPNYTKVYSKRTEGTGYAEDPYLVPTCPNCKEPIKQRTNEPR